MHRNIHMIIDYGHGFSFSSQFFGELYAANRNIELIKFNFINLTYLNFTMRWQNVKFLIFFFACFEIF